MPWRLLIAIFLLALASTSEFLREQEKLMQLCSEQFDVVTILRAAREATAATVWGWWHGPWIQVEMPYYRPLTSMLYLAEWRLFGHRYLLYSLVSWLLHAVNTTLLGALVYRLVPGDARRRAMFGAVAAGLFSVPYWGNMAVPSQVVLWWPAQGDLLALGFGFGALIAWDRVLMGSGRLLPAVLLLLLAILSKEMAYVVPPMIWLLALHRLRLSPLPALSERRFRHTFFITAAIAGLLWVLRRVFVPAALGFKWKGLYSLKKLYYSLGGPLGSMALVDDWALPVAALGGALLIGAFGRRRLWLLGGLAALIWAGAAFQVLGQSWTRVLMDANPWLLTRGLAYWFAVGLLWRWRREEPVMFVVGAIALIVLPLLHHGGTHYLYWPAAGWAMVNAVAWACAARSLAGSRAGVVE